MEKTKLVLFELIMFRKQMNEKGKKETSQQLVAHNLLILEFSFLLALLFFVNS